MQSAASAFSTAPVWTVPGSSACCLCAATRPISQPALSRPHNTHTLISLPLCCLHSAAASMYPLHQHSLHTKFAFSGNYICPQSASRSACAPLCARSLSLQLLSHHGAPVTVAPWGGLTITGSELTGISDPACGLQLQHVPIAAPTLSL